MFFLLSFSPKLGQLLLELRDSLALLSMAILHPIPVLLLTGFAAVAVGLASLAQLAGGGTQRGTAHLARLSKDTKGFLNVRQMMNVRQMVEVKQLLSIGQPGRQI